MILSILLRLLLPLTMIGWQPADEVQFYREIRMLVDKIGVDAYNYIYGDMIVERKPSSSGYSCWSSMICYGDISLAPGSKHEGILLHEMGHVFLNRLELRGLRYSIGYRDEAGRYVHVSGLNPVTWRYERTSLGYPHPGQPYEQHSPLAPGTGQSVLEDFADMYMNWVRGTFSDCPAGQARQRFMDDFIADALRSVPKVHHYTEYHLMR